MSTNIGVVFIDREFEKFGRVGEAGAEFIESFDNLFELRPLLPQRLRAPGFIPNVGLFEFAPDFGQSFGLAVVVKDTSSTHRCVQ